MRVVIVTENASMRMSGETSLPLYYFKGFLARNIDVWMVCHSRVREELRQMFPDDKDFRRIHFVEDDLIQAAIWKIGKWFPYRINDLILGQLIHLLSQRKQRSVVKRLISEFDIQVVFEPSPISPQGLSYMYDMGVPVAIGPLCGGMEFPPAFKYMDSPLTRFSIGFGRLLSRVLHRLVPGKIQASTLIVGNERTAKVLPQGYTGKVYTVVESGVNLSLWQPKSFDSNTQQTTRFVYMARFVDWKGIQFLVEAFKQVAQQTDSVLELIGDGELFEEIKARVVELGIQDKVNLHGRMPLEDCEKLIRNCDVYMVPALRECGGCAILEAMAIGMPMIVANWAGPGEYVDSSCGILVDPTSKEEFINGLATAMIQLAESPELRQKMGEASTQRVRTNYFDWDSKINRVIEILQETIARSGVKTDEICVTSQKVLVEKQ